MKWFQLLGYFDFFFSVFSSKPSKCYLSSNCSSVYYSFILHMINVIYLEGLIELPTCWWLVTFRMLLSATQRYCKWHGSPTGTKRHHNRIAQIIVIRYCIKYLFVSNRSSLQMTALIFEVRFSSWKWAQTPCPKCKLDVQTSSQYKYKR